jgi:hypothetical protein
MFWAASVGVCSTGQRFNIVGAANMIAAKISRDEFHGNCTFSFKTLFDFFFDFVNSANKEKEYKKPFFA